MYARARGFKGFDSSSSSSLRIQDGLKCTECTPFSPLNPMHSPAMPQSHRPVRAPYVTSRPRGFNSSCTPHPPHPIPTTPLTPPDHTLLSYPMTPYRTLSRHHTIPRLHSRPKWGGFLPPNPHPIHTPVILTLPRPHPTHAFFTPNRLNPSLRDGPRDLRGRRGRRTRAARVGFGGGALLARQGGRQVP